MYNLYPDYQGYQGFQGNQALLGDQTLQGNPAFYGDQALQGNPFYGNEAFQGYPEYQDNRESVVDPYQAAAPCPSCENAMPFGYSPTGLNSFPGVAGHFCNEALTRLIQECEASCEYATTHIKCKTDLRRRRNQLILLRDCADICGDTAKFVARGSEFDKEKAILCARICECCGQECKRFCDRISQHCAEICFHCAKACRAFAQGY